MKLLKKALLIMLGCTMLLGCVPVVTAGSNFTWEENKQYMLTGTVAPSAESVSLPAMSTGSKGQFGISYFGMYEDELYDMNWQENGAYWWYAYPTATIAVTAKPAVWGAASTMCELTKAAYMVLCFEAPKSGTMLLNATIGLGEGCSADVFVTKNGIAEGERISGADENGTFMLEVTEGDCFYIHVASREDIKDGSYAALSAWIKYTAFAKEAAEIDWTPGTFYLLTGNTASDPAWVMLPEKAANIQGGCGLYQYAMEGSQLRDMTYVGAQGGWQYGTEGGETAILSSDAWDGATSTKAVGTAAAYPVLCFEAPRSGDMRLNVLCGWSTDGCTEVFITKNGTADTDRLCGADESGTFTLRVTEGDRFYIHVRPTDKASDSDHTALSAWVQYSAFRTDPVEIDWKTGQIYLLSGNTAPANSGWVALPALARGSAGDCGLYYYGMYGSELQPMQYNSGEKKWWYAPEGAVNAAALAPFVWPGAQTTMAAVTADVYPVLCFEVPKTGNLQLNFQHALSVPGCAEVFVTKNGISDADRLTGADGNGTFTLDVKAGDKLYFHTKTMPGAANGSFAALSVWICYTYFTQPVGEQKFITASDEVLNYLGRWEKEGDMMVSYWTTPSVSFHFTGTSLHIDLGLKSSIGVELDGVVQDFDAALGRFQITVPSGGEHSVKVYGPNMHLKGFWVDADSEVSRVENASRYVMFIGDSISAAHASFSFNAGRQAGWDWSVYALDGISMCDQDGGYYFDGMNGWGYYTNGYYPGNALAGWTEDKRIGMESAFFHYERPIDKLDDFTPYPFANERQPDVIVIALGVNDYLRTSAMQENFIEHYAAFARRLRTIYPDATIYMLQALMNNPEGLRYDAISGAAERVLKSDANAVFVSDTPTWGVQISSDGIHPSVKGYGTMTEHIADLLRAYRRTFTVTFRANGHGNAPSAQRVAAGEKVGSPTAPTADGCTFAGWYRDADCRTPWDFEHDTVDGNLTLWAKWEQNDPGQKPSAPQPPASGGSAFARRQEVKRQQEMFDDVQIAAPYSDALLWARRQGLVAGVSARSFAPDRPCTREQLITMLWRADGRAHAGGTLPFTDVPQDIYCTTAIRWANERRIVAGLSAERFGMAQPCTLEQLLVFFWRFSGAPATDTDVRMGTLAEDGAVSAYAEHAVRWAYGTGLVLPEELPLALLKPCSRGEAVLYLYRLLMR